MTSPSRTPGSGHVARRRPSQLHRHRADLDDSARAIGEEDHLRGHLLRKAQQVRGIRAGRLEPDAVRPAIAFARASGVGESRPRLG